MFKTEQNISQNRQNRFEKAVFQNGMALANKVIVKKGITFRELTLILGIAVALVVALIFAKTASEKTTTGLSSGNMNIITLPSSGGKVIKSAIDILL
jgi:hypothetical protein